MKIDVLAYAAKITCVLTIVIMAAVLFVGCGYRYGIMNLPDVIASRAAAQGAMTPPSQPMHERNVPVSYSPAR